ncbi:MAG: hypothetical protein ACTSUE_26180 [Promethearchaeota archaeon]
MEQFVSWWMVASWVRCDRGRIGGCGGVGAGAWVREREDNCGNCGAGVHE